MLGPTVHIKIHPSSLSSTSVTVNYLLLSPTELTEAVNSPTLTSLDKTTSLADMSSLSSEITSLLSSSKKSSHVWSKFQTETGVEANHLFLPGVSLRASIRVSMRGCWQGQMETKKRVCKALWGGSAVF